MGAEARSDRFVRDCGESFITFAGTAVAGAVALIVSRCVTGRWSAFAGDTVKVCGFWALVQLLLALGAIFWAGVRLGFNRWRRIA